MRKLMMVCLFAVGFILTTTAQVLDPVSWNFSQKKLSDTEYELTFKAEIEAGWHLYSTDIPEGGPIKTSFRFDDNNAIDIQGTVTPDHEPERKFDPTFQMDLAWFSNAVTFTQKVKVNTTSATSLTGAVEFMVCNDETCLPPTEIEYDFAFNKDAKAEVVAPADGTNETEEKSYLGIFIISFLAGFTALLTPCVFPMIPMTMSFFTKQGEKSAKGIRDAVIYGISIIAIYVFLGTVVTAIFGADSLNSLSTNPWFNLFFGILLIVFAFSFMGAFELVLPYKWVNAIDAKADKGGFLGIFFMAFALALVSFSCTGPIVGSLIVEAARNGGLAPVIGMLGFGLALAIPFTLFAMFPKLLNSLPKSGGWLNSVKVVLGFLELAFAFKFFSITDMVLDLHLLEREVFIAIWIAIFGGLAMYLLGKIKLPHDSPMDHLGVGRFMSGLFVLAFVVYMIPGLWGAPVKWISGFPPPVDYAESPMGVGKSSAGFAGAHASTIETSHEQHIGPHGIPLFDDYETALAYAKKVNKPLLIDFTGKGCTNCRKMEDNVWVDPTVKKHFFEDFVIVSLYVDLRKKLPEAEQGVSKTTGKKIKTVGNKWTDFQISRFNRNTQPFYVILDHNEKQVSEGKGYDPSAENFINFLQDGLNKFNTTK